MAAFPAKKKEKTNKQEATGDSHSISQQICFQTLDSNQQHKIESSRRRGMKERNVD